MIGTTLGILIATLLIVIAAHFTWRQLRTFAAVRSDSQLPDDQKRFLYRQGQRRLFGSALLFILAGLMAGLLFLDFDPWQRSPDNIPQVDRETAKQSVRFLGVYVMSMLLLLMVILVLAILDFWATARFSVRQQKRLIEEHQKSLESDLAQLRQRRLEDSSGEDF